MGIKTKFNPMGGISGSNEPDLGNLSLWRYSNDVVAGRTLLYNYVGTNARLYGYSWWLGEPNMSSDTIYYLKVDPPVEGANIYYANGALYTDYVSNGIFRDGTYFMGSVPVAGERQWYWRNYSTDIDLGYMEYPTPLYVPKAKGKAIINNWVSATASGTIDSNRNTPFFNNKNIVSVDLQEVNFRSNSMSNAFNGCNNLTSIVNIPSSVTNMESTFYNCRALNQKVQVSNSVRGMVGTFSGCNNLNQNIQIPSSVTNMSNTFNHCSNLNQNIQIPNSVTSMSNTFSYCYNLNQNIQIPSSVTNMSYTFYSCRTLNQNIQIPSSVTNMYYTFALCSNLEGRINILSANVTDATDCFAYSTNKHKNVYYISGETTVSFRRAGYIYDNGLSTGKDNTSFYQFS